jgi:DNA-binding PadR family transcriptional regulator
MARASCVAEVAAYCIGTVGRTSCILYIDSIYSYRIDIQETAVLDLAVLGLLREGPHHGYEVRSRLHDLGFRRFSFGSLYPAIKRLESRGYIEAIRGSTSRRKAYQLTPKGADAFNELLSADDVEDGDERRFRIRLAFFGHLDTAERLRILKDRRAVVMERLADLRRTRRRMSATDHYPLALVERSIATTESELAWIDGLAATERAHT